MPPELLARLFLSGRSYNSLCCEHASELSSGTSALIKTEFALITFASMGFYKTSCIDCMLNMTDRHVIMSVAQGSRHSPKDCVVRRSRAVIVCASGVREKPLRSMGLVVSLLIA